MKYKVTKVLNNNVVICVDGNMHEVLATGKGIGYGVKPGIMISDQNVKQLYFPQSSGFIRKLSTVVNEIPIEYFDCAQTIKELAETKLQLKLHENIIIALADHINFAVSQYHSGERRAVLLDYEIQRFYPMEYELGKEAVIIVEQQFNISCQKGEAGAFAFHIINGEVNSNSEDVRRITQSIKDILNIIETGMNIKLLEDSMDYSRLIIHLKFFLRRVITNTVSNDEFTQLLLNPDEGAFKGISNTLNEISAYMEKTFGHSLNESERVYLLIHIARVVMNAKQKN